MKLQTSIEGFAHLEKALKELPRELVSKGGRGAGNPVFQALNKAADPVLSSMQNLAPYKSGRLRGAIKKQRHPRPKYINEIVGVGVDPGRSREDTTGAWYGYIVEANTGFMKRSAEKNQNKVPEIFGRELGASIEKIGKKLERAQKKAKK